MIIEIIVKKGIESIGNHAFYKCSVEKIELSDGVTSIGKYAFDNCSKLSSIIMPEDITLIDESAFQGCTSLSSIIVPNSVKLINNYVFYGCCNLTNITIPDGVTSLGNEVFAGCSSLENVTIPGSVTSIGHNAFAECLNLIIYCNVGSYAEKYAKENGKEYGVICGEKVTATVDENGVLTISGTGAMNNYDNCYTLSPFYFLDTINNVVLEQGVTSIGDFVFYGCSKIVNITIPDSVTSVGDYAFCNDCLVNVTIIDGVTAIGAHTFAGCTELKNVTIPKSIISIGENAFGGCSSLTIHGYKGSYAETYAANNSISFVALPSLEITSQPTDYTGKIGDTAVFTVEAIGKNLTYQWEQNTGNGWVAINTSAGRSMKFSVAIAEFRLGYKYRCVISDETMTIISDEVKMTLAEETLAITSQPTDYVGEIGNTAKFTVEATGATSYQWYQNTGSGWVALNTIAGHSNTINIPVVAFRVGFKYYCEVSDGTNTIKSDEVTIKLDETLAIKTQPVDFVGNIGDTAKFTVEATGATSYQWYQNTGSSWVAMNTTAGRSKSISIAVAQFRVGFQYKCVVSDGTNTITSDTVSIKLDEVLGITAQPTDYIGAIGDTAKFTIEATGATSYQWYQNTGSGWVALNTTAGHSNTISIPVVAFRVGFKYYCEISDGTNAVKSDEVTIRLAETLAITSQPEDYVGTIGGNATFTVTATGAKTYQWYQNTGSGWVAINTAAGRSNTITIPVAAFRVGFQYRCEASDGTTITSEIAELLI